MAVKKKAPKASKYTRKNYEKLDAYKDKIKTSKGTFLFVLLAPASAKAKLPIVVADIKTGVTSSIKFTDVKEIIEAPYSYPEGTVTIDKLRKAKARETCMASSSYPNRIYMFMGMHPNKQLPNCAIISGMSPAAGTQTLHYNTAQLSKYKFKPMEGASDEVSIVVDGKTTIISRASAQALNLI